MTIFLQEPPVLLELHFVIQIRATLAAAGLGFDLPISEDVVAQPEQVAAGKQ